jgi:regulator of sigma E protease
VAQGSPDDPRGFTAQALWRKVLIITAGVLMNGFLAFILYTAVIWHEGVGRLTGNALTGVMAGSPAASAGLQIGDVITEAAGQKVGDWSELTSQIRSHPGVGMPISWRRGDSLFRADITPEATPEFDLETGHTDTVGKIGVLGTFTTDPVGPGEAVIYGAAQVWWVVRLNIVSLTALFLGHAQLSDLTGPIGIAKLSGESARSGLSDFVSFIAMISVSIGFLNLMPIPMLDGGHLALMLVEAVIRRRIPEKVKVNLMKVGLAALLMLVLFVSYHDIIRIFFAGD